MRLRCWPGCLAYITHPTMFGKMVEVVHAAPVGVVFTLPNGRRHDPCVVSDWVIRALGEPFPADGVVIRRPNEYAACSDVWLRPILPPPGAETETVADVLEAARNEPAEA